MRNFVFCCSALLSCTGAMGQTSVDLRTQGKNVDFSNATVTRPFKTGATLPATCSQGDTFFLTVAPAGQNFYGCSATNVWANQGAPGSGGGGSGTVTSTGGLLGDGTPTAPLRLNTASQRTISGSGTFTISSLNLANDSCLNVSVVVAGAESGDKATVDLVMPSEIGFVFVEGIHVRPGIVDTRICNRSGALAASSNVVVSAWTWGLL